MVTGMTLVQDLLPPRQLNEGMAVAVSGIVIGISAGSSLAGLVAEHAGPGAGYRLPAAAAALALLIALAGRRHLEVGAPAKVLTGVLAASAGAGAARAGEKASDKGAEASAPTVGAPR